MRGSIGSRGSAIGSIPWQSATLSFIVGPGDLVTSGEDVQFEPVFSDATPKETEDESARSQPLASSGQRARTQTREARRDPFPLAGPILEGARSELLRGRCSACESRLRVRLDPSAGRVVRIRCPICGHTGEIQR